MDAGLPLGMNRPRVVDDEVEVVESRPRSVDHIERLQRRTDDVEESLERTEPDLERLLRAGLGALRILESRELDPEDLEERKPDETVAVDPLRSVGVVSVVEILDPLRGPGSQ